MKKKLANANRTSKHEHRELTFETRQKNYIALSGKRRRKQTQTLGEAAAQENEQIKLLQV